MKTLMALFIVVSSVMANTSAFERAIATLDASHLEEPVETKTFNLEVRANTGTPKVSNGSILNSKNSKELKRRIIDEKLAVYLDAETIATIKSFSKFTNSIKKIDTNKIYVQYSWRF